MPTQEERLTTLERSMTNVNAAISEINHNETILPGIVVKQDENIREVKLHLVAVNERLSSLETTLDKHTSVLSEHTSILNQHTTLLTQILARLPEKP